MSEEKIIEGKTVETAEEETEYYRTMFSTNKGINVSTTQKALPIDEVMFGSLGWAVYNYVNQLKENSKDKSEEELNKIMEELKDVLYFKFKTLLLSVFSNMFGQFDDIDYVEHLIKKEKDMIKELKKKETKKETKKDK